MDNVSDAIKIAGAALIFILFLTITVRLYGQARETAEIVLFSADSTNYYQLMEPNEENVTRVVGIETIVPTLFTYCQTDGPAIRIIYGPEDDIAKYEMIFDTEMENIIKNGIPSIGSTDEISEDIIKLYNKYHDAYYGAPWASGDSNKSGYLNHINDFLYGTSHKYNYTDVYAQKNIPQYNFLNKYENSLFEESYVEFNTSGFYKEDGFGNWFTIVDGNQKTIITYKYVGERST